MHDDADFLEERIMNMENDTGRQEQVRAFTKAREAGH